MPPSSARNVAVVTGATGGIGKEIARGLAQAEMTVVIGARSIERGEAAAAAEIAASSNGAAPAPSVMKPKADQFREPAAIADLERSSRELEREPGT
jgi:NAD(P)-dependent dehydrogenase (short-subunit alcohol dehydrogenase family)